jgi:hypothetical protein
MAEAADDGEALTFRFLGTMKVRLFSACLRSMMGKMVEEEVQAWWTWNENEVGENVTYQMLAS